MNVKTKIISITIFFCFLFGLFTSCHNKGNTNLIDVTLISNLAVSQKWAMIDTVYVAFYKNYDKNSEIKAHGRRGDILEVEGYHISEDGENWYLFNKGWLPDDSIKIFENKLQAQFATEKIAINNK